MNKELNTMNLATLAMLSKSYGLRFDIVENKFRLIVPAYKSTEKDIVNFEEFQEALSFVLGYICGVQNTKEKEEGK